MCRTHLFVLCLAAAALAAGCGGGEEAFTAQGSVPRRALIELGDLPGKAVVAEDLPEPCGPLGVFEPTASDTALSKMFAVRRGKARVKEAVASFENASEAQKAFEALDLRKRKDCILQAILQFSPPGSRLTDEPTRDLPFADEARSTNYVVVPPIPKLPGSFTAVSLRRGSCVAALLVLVEGRRSDAPLTRSLASVAGDLLRRC
jgi:hypothetical protein